MPSVAGGAVAIAVAAMIAAAAIAAGRVPAAAAVAIFFAVASLTASLTMSAAMLVLRLLAVVVSIACAFLSARRSIVGLAAVLAGSAAVLAFSSSCTVVYAVDGVAAAVTVAVTAALVGPLALCASELLVVLVFLGADSGAVPRSRHLTWWGIAAVAALDAAVVLLPRRRRLAIASAQAVISLTVVAGTVLMSVMRCDVLNDAFADLGPVGYVAGNFLIHYYPAARGFSSVSTTRVSAPVVVSGAVAGVSIVSAYTAVVLPASTYGCGLSEPVSIAALAAGSLMSAIAVFLVVSNHDSRVIMTHGAAATAT